MIQIHRLEGFYWVARTGGYAKAARAFPYPITQPAVHQQVKKLETDLGLELFERVAKDRMQLTSAGQRLYRFVAPFFEGLPAVVRAVKSGEYEGELEIHAAPMFMRRLLPAWIQRLQKRRPGVRIRLRELPDPDFRPLRQGDADLLVDHFPDLPNDVASLRIGTLRAFVVLPASHPLAGRKRIALAQFADDTFVSYNPGLLAHDQQTKVLAMHGLAPKRSLSAASADTILGFVEAGLGFSIVPSLEPEGPRSHGVVAVPLAAPKVEFPVYAVWRKDTPENPLLDAALETAPKP